eukprot:GHVS01085835.1.p1 GENE.GHVS01085835.1~~GHVS01085835.1.p1  ORF type:complete len:329 (+),score=79.72 GHVS01085835.1:57-1043(+)
MSVFCASPVSLCLAIYSFLLFLLSNPVVVVGSSSELSSEEGGWWDAAELFAHEKNGSREEEEEEWDISSEGEEATGDSSESTASTTARPADKTHRLRQRTIPPVGGVGEFGRAISKAAVRVGDQLADLIDKLPPVESLMSTLTGGPNVELPMPSNPCMFVMNFPDNLYLVESSLKVSVNAAKRLVSVRYSVVAEGGLMQKNKGKKDSYRVVTVSDVCDLRVVNNGKSGFALKHQRRQRGKDAAAAAHKQQGVSLKVWFPVKQKDVRGRETRNSAVDRAGSNSVPSAEPWSRLVSWMKDKLHRAMYGMNTKGDMEEELSLNRMPWNDEF